MISWLIGVVTGMIYDCIGIAARLKPEDEARRLKASWALSLGVWNSGGALPFLSSAREHGWPDFALLPLL